MNALKLAALVAVTFAVTHSFAAVNLENTANYFAVDFTVHTMPENQEYNFVLNKKNLTGAKFKLPLLPGNCVDRITINKVIKQG